MDRFVATVAGIGVLAHVLGQALPRRWFSPQAAPWARRAGPADRRRRIFKIDRMKYQNLLFSGGK